ncbi:MAG: outer rane peptidoglycan-associated protein, partial [Bacteroidota bacterium]|nr:outer rane peptidoglycan-associated protein [Bacteroidota bacterium]
MKIKFLFKPIVIAAGLLVWTCTFALPGDKFDKKLYKKEADAALKEGNVFYAVDLYSKIWEHDSTDKTVLYNLAQSYMLEKDYETAGTYFQKAYKAEPGVNILALYYGALAIKMQGRYNEAIPMFKQFSKTYAADDAPKMKKWAKTEVDGCNFALREAKSDPSIKFNHLGKEVNSNYADQAPTLRDDVLYFASIRSDTVFYLKPDKSDSKKEGVMMKLYTSKQIGDSYGPAEQLKTFGHKGKHISNGAFNDDGTKFLYTLCEP